MKMFINCETSVIIMSCTVALLQKWYERVNLS